MNMIQQDCFKCEKTYEHEDIREICPECEEITKRIEPKTIKASELAGRMGISFTKII